MFGIKPDEKTIKKMMEKMNMNVREIEAEKVVIHSNNKNIVITSPNIMVMNIGGKDVYQIAGAVKEQDSVDEKDIEIAMKKTGKSRETVVGTLRELDNDLARAIRELKKK